MNKFFNLIKWGITLGSGSQNFLGAGWVQIILNRTPKEKLRQRALQILSLSPHYFINGDSPEYAGMSNREYLESSFAGGRRSRKKIMDQILKGRIGADDTVLDYGCGPGFLAWAIAPHVKHVYAADISPGALACARILNPAPNVDYLTANQAGMATIVDESIDAVMSFAVLQHVSDEIYELIISSFWQKLKPGGRLILHIQLHDGIWKTEDEWRADRSVRGRLKLRYGLHCFGRSPDSHLGMIARSGFIDGRIESIADLVTENFDDICSQHLLTASKP